MSARNTRATAHAPRSQRTSTRPLPKSWTPNRPVSRCPQTVNAVHSSLWTKGAELKHDVICLRSLVDVQSKSPSYVSVDCQESYIFPRNCHITLLGPLTCDISNRPGWHWRTGGGGLGGRLPPPPKWKLNHDLFSMYQLALAPPPPKWN